MGEYWLILNKTRNEMIKGCKWREGGQAESLMQALKRRLWSVGDVVKTIGEYEISDEELEKYEDIGLFW